MTQHPNSLNNLKPFKPGQSGNPKGRPKGVKNWSTIIQQLLADEELVDKVVKTKPAFWDSLPTKNAANAIVTVMIMEALKGKKEAAEWLRKSGFGDKLMVESEDGLFQTQKIEVEIVKSNIEDERDAKS